MDNGHKSLAPPRCPSHHTRNDFRGLVRHIVLVTCDRPKNVTDVRISTRNALTEQWFFPPGRGSISLGQIIPPKNYLLPPSRPEGKAGGSESGGAPIREIGWPAADRVAPLPIPLASIHLSSKSFDLHCCINFFRDPPTVPRADQPFGSARLGSEKRFLMNRRE